MEIYHKSLKHRDYYQLTSGLLESEIGGIDFYHIPREMNQIPFRIRDI